MKKVFKFATGQEIPKGGIYLNTIKQTEMIGIHGKLTPCWLVWHYFLVEVDNEKS